MERPHILVVEARYYAHINEELLKGALAALAEAGATHEHIVVPGAFEIPAAIRFAVATNTPFDGYVALGCVVKGDTDHYEYVCREAMAGITQVVLQFGLCLGNGLLTVHTVQQALDRSTADGHNKGAEAAAAALIQIRAARWLGAV